MSLDRFESFLSCNPDTILFLNLEGVVLEVWEGHDPYLLDVLNEFNICPDYFLKEILSKPMFDLSVKTFNVASDVWFECRAMRYKEDEIFMVCRDVTDMLKSKSALETKILEHTQELKKINQDLQMFLYSASHDLQEPIQKIKGFSNRLFELSSNFTEEQKFLLGVIQSGANRMSDLLTDLLSFVRAGGNIDFSEVALSSVFLDLKQNIFSNKKIGIPDNLPVVQGDYDLLFLLFQNLISNALKFQPKNQEPVITIECEIKNDFYVISVIDNGIGFSMTHKDKIFNIFERLHSRFEFPGTGVGLALCKRIAQKHKGDITVISEEGKGSRFMVHIPKGREFFLW